MKKWFSARRMFRVLFILWGLLNVLFMITSSCPYTGVYSFIEYNQIQISFAFIFFYLAWRLRAEDKAKTEAGEQEAKKSF